MRSSFVALAVAMAAAARPMRRDATDLANGQAAIALNNQYKTLSTSASCTAGEDACVTGKFAQCVGGKFVLQSCAAGTICAAIPLDGGDSGTLTTCTTQTDLDTRIAATGATSASSSTGASTSVSSSTGAGTSDTSSSSSSAAASTSTSTVTTDNSNSGSSVTGSNSTSTSDSTGSSNTITATGALSTDSITAGATENNPDPQSSLTLDPRVIASGFLNNGQDVQEAGQVASITSNNNFINYCLTQGNLPITNGLQITSGSCNPAPIGTIPSVGNMPSSKFSSPANGDTIAANTAFNITMNIQNLETGNFVNANENYFAAPQQLNALGAIIGHTHFVVEAINGLADTAVTNPQSFAFFKGVNTPAENGAVSAPVTNGLPAGTYRLCSINSSSNHQPVIVPVAQHGGLDDCVYFTASAGGSATAAASASA